jgi:CYTH domain-containing protein
MIEKEFKYLIDPRNVPKEIFECNFVDIEQGYISDKCDLSTEIRVRIETRNEREKYILTIKKKTERKGERIEIEIELSEKDFKEVWTLTEGKRLRKRRYLIPRELSNGRIIFMELDIFRGKFSGHVTLEAEEKEEGDLENFVPPDWVNVDVTGDERYSNKNLVFCGLRNIE